MLKDDKSFSSILFNLSHSFPQLSAHRGQRNIKGDYFGPFVSKKTVQKTIETLQKIFLLRTCNDNIFKSRTRPCLQFQIKRCSAPCVNLISKESYRDSLNEAKKFLQGNSKSIKQNLIKKMYDASNKQNFEAAAIFRNRIKALTDVNASQNINVPNVNDVDFLVLRKIENKVVIQMTIVRSGCNYGSKSYFPSPGKNGTDVLEEEIMQAFICQFYDKNIPPENILVNLNPKDKSLISSNKNNLKNLQQTFNFKNSIQKLEVYDNSHNQGKSPVGAMIAFNEDGFLKSLYRRYNISTEHKNSSKQISDEFINNNDYLMMKEVIKRRFAGKNSSGFPDLIIIDGGKGHLNIVLNVLIEKIFIQKILIVLDLTKMILHYFFFKN